MDEEILCCNCGKIPKILSVHSDNGNIELECKKDGKYEISIDDYFDKLSKNNFFKKCNHCKTKGISNKYYYCFICKKDYCEKCKNKLHSGHEYIEAKEKNKICLKHNKTIKYYCFDDEENFCEQEKELEHKGHKIKEIQNFEKFISDYQIKNNLEEINEELKKLVDFNVLVLKNIEIFKDNKLYINSIKNMGKSLKEGNKRNSKDTKCLLYDLSKYIENSRNAIEKLGEKNISLHRTDKYIDLNNYLYNNNKLNDQDFKYISQIRFNQLKEIDISENKITNIEPFNKMSLPFLEFLNLSYNEIQIIEPVTKINSKILQYIFLQKNQIKDIGSFLDSNFENIKIIRIENNINLKNKNVEEQKNLEETLKRINKKYPQRFIYKSIEEQKQEFKTNYKYEISWDNEVIDLSDFQGGDKMLLELFLIITYVPKNQIKILKLMNNQIKDPSILNRVNFVLLEKLDLSINMITDLKFLLDMKAKNLKYLFLDNNKFSDFSPLLRNIFPKLNNLSLHKNMIDFKDNKNKLAYIELKNKKDQNGNKIVIQLGPYEEYLNDILNGNS